MEGIKSTCTALVADRVKFDQAGAALANMITSYNKANFSLALAADSPLLVFITPEWQYHKWQSLQVFKVSMSNAYPADP